MNNIVSRIVIIPSNSKSKEIQPPLFSKGLNDTQTRGRGSCEGEGVGGPFFIFSLSTIPQKLPAHFSNLPIYRHI